MEELQTALAIVAPHVLVSGIVFSLFWIVAIALGARQYRSRGLLMLLITAAVFWQGFLLLAFHGSGIHAVLLGTVTLPLVFTGPLLRHYFQRVLMERKAGIREILPHLALTGAAYAATVFTLAIRHTPPDISDWRRVAIFLPALCVVAYIAFPVRVIALSGLKNLSRMQRVILLKLAVISATMLMLAAGSMLNAPSLLYAGGIFLSGILFVSYVFSEVWPQLLGEVGERARNYALSKLMNVDIESLRAGIRSLMQTRKIYLREDLTLPALAAELGISAHQLSEYLNRHEGMSFPEFINRHRVEEAQRLLKEPQKRVNILAVAYAVGFDSKTNFYRAFARFTGTNPSAYRKSLDF